MMAVVFAGISHNAAARMTVHGASYTISEFLDQEEGQFFDRKSARIQPRDSERVHKRTDDRVYLRVGDQTRIVRALTDLGFVRDIGEGVDRIFEEMAGASLPPPEFREREYAVIVTLRKMPKSNANSRAEPVEGPGRTVHLPANIARALNKRQVAALRLLREKDSITTADLIREFPNLSDRTASADLMGLVVLKLLHRVGRTRGTYYHSGGVSYLLPNEL